MTPTQIADLKRLWKRALLLTYEGHWLQSEVAVTVFSEAGGDKGVAYEVFGRIGVPANTKAKLYAMNGARFVVSDKDVWLAAGWSGVRTLAGMNKREREAKVKAIRKEIKAGTKPKAAAAKILKKPEPKTPHKVKEHERGGGLLEKVLSDMTKLVAFNPATLDLLSDDVRKAVQARLKARKTA